MSKNKWAALFLCIPFTAAILVYLAYPLFNGSYMKEQKENEAKCNAIKEYKATWLAPRCIITFKD